MKVFIGFDDTDVPGSEFGTGKVSRWFEKILPAGTTCTGVVRQQLLVCDDIPYTSHNSSACMIVEVEEDRADNGIIRELKNLAAGYLVDQAAEGSDPGLCIISEYDSSLRAVMDYGYTCTHTVSTQKEALDAVNRGILLGLGGSNDGLIGAAAAVGLTASGWSGRYIEFGNLRQYPEVMAVQAFMSDKSTSSPLIGTREGRRPRTWLSPMAGSGRTGWGINLCYSSLQRKKAFGKIFISSAKKSTPKPASLNRADNSDPDS